MSEDYSVSANDISGLKHVIDEYNDAVANGNLEKAVAAGTFLEHALAHMHMGVVYKIDCIINELAEKEIKK